jgi:hypothetical protein
MMSFGQEVIKLLNFQVYKVSSLGSMMDSARVAAKAFQTHLLLFPSLWINEFMVVEEFTLMGLTRPHRITVLLQRVLEIRHF